MTPEAIGYAAALIASKREPVTLYVRYGSDHGCAEVTDRIPRGRSLGVCAGRFDASITLAELRDDLNASHQELARSRRVAA